jgi:hypothetical protein
LLPRFSKSIEAAAADPGNKLRAVPTFNAAAMPPVAASKFKNSRLLTSPAISLLLFNPGLAPQYIGRYDHHHLTRNNSIYSAP